jgi:NAD(P)-dependent dehydrogenase (short-subunit alcohol dehydrogenase family)
LTLNKNANKLTNITQGEGAMDGKIFAQRCSAVSLATATAQVIDTVHAPYGDLQDRVALVTGANAGLGFQTVLQLAQHGASVTLACRSEERGRAAIAELQAIVPRAKLQLAIVDVSNFDSIHAFAADYKRRVPKLDLLCNNAAAIAVPFSLSPQGIERHMATNYFGPFLLTGLLLDLLRDAACARVVNISSQIHRLAKLSMDDLNWEYRTYKPFAAYAQSKAALTCFTLELHRRLSKRGVGVKALMAHPGFAATDVPLKGSLYRFANTILKPLVMHSGLVQSAADGARSSLYALASPDAQGGDYIGPDNWLGTSGAPARTKAASNATDPALAAKLWARSVQVTGIEYLS